MVPVNTVVRLAVLTAGARVESGQPGNSVELILRGSIIVHKRAAVGLGAGAPEEMIIAELVVVLALPDDLQDGLVDGDGLVEAARTGIPLWLLLLLSGTRAGGAGGQRDGDLRRGTGGLGGGFLGHGGVGREGGGGVG